MDADRLPAGCADRSCAGDCERAQLSRRTFLALSATGIGALAVPGQAAAALLEPPARHTLSPGAVATLYDRGVPTEYAGAALPKIGMPVGGGTCGQVFLAGDGRLWAWDIFNPIVEVRYGEVRLATLSFQTVEPVTQVTIGPGERQQAATVVASGNRALVTLPAAVTVPAGQTLEVELS